MAKGRVLTIQNLTAAQRDDLEAMQEAGGASVQVIPQGGNLFTIVATYPDTNDPPAGGAQPAGGAPAGGAPAGGAPAGGAPHAAGSPVMNDAGFNLLKKWEGCILFAYDDANDRRVNPGDTVQGTLTIGYGHTGPGVVPGLTWTQDQAEAALHHDIDIVVQQIRPLITCQLNDNQFSAFVCFAYNIGVQGFAGSSALHLANAGNLTNVPAAIALWNKARVNGVAVPSPGLTNRRNAEIDLWNSTVAVSPGQLPGPHASDPSPRWIYAQKTGNMFHVENGVPVLEGSGYSGNGADENNPASQFIPQHGPIPQGWYTIGPPEPFKNMVNCLPLTPDPGNNMGGRSGFLIHDGAFNNPLGHGNTSEGCICLPQIRRIEIWDSGDRRLQVVADLPVSK
jgi:GH24 family phage-related lysozyme (muramidase)